MNCVKRSKELQPAKHSEEAFWCLQTEAMTEHYTSNTESVWKWCNTCMKNTTHSVSANRLGRCLEHGAKDKPAEKKDLQENKTLFE